MPDNYKNKNNVENKNGNTIESLIKILIAPFIVIFSIVFIISSIFFKDDQAEELASSATAVIFKDLFKGFLASILEWAVLIFVLILLIFLFIFN